MKQKFQFLRCLLLQIVMHSHRHRNKMNRQHNIFKLVGSIPTHGSVMLKFTNTMAQGTNNFQTSTLTRHVSGSDHQRAMAAPNEQKRMSVAAEKALSKEEEAVQVAMIV